MDKIISADQITLESLDNLSEDTVYELLNTIIKPLPVEVRSQYMSLIRKKFDIRTISSTKNNLKKDMILFGFKFFQIPNNENFIMGIKRQHTFV
jgi:hypothetical protein